MEHMCLLFELECPACGGENAYLSSIENEGRYFCCPDCKEEWYDLRFVLEQRNDADNNV